MTASRVISRKQSLEGRHIRYTGGSCCASDRCQLDRTAARTCIYVHNFFRPRTASPVFVASSPLLTHSLSNLQTINAYGPPFFLMCYSILSLFDYLHTQSLHLIFTLFYPSLIRCFGLTVPHAFTTPDLWLHGLPTAPLQHVIASSR